MSTIPPAYRFLDRERAIEILRPDTPSPWINYLSNGNFHAFVSQAGGGFAWWKSPLLFRLTRYRMHHLPTDSPGFYTYVREEDGETWSPSWRPCGVRPDEWSATHRPGSTRFRATKGGLRADLSFFVAPETDALIWDLRLENAGGEVKRGDLFAYAELSQLNWMAEHLFGYYLKHMVKTWQDRESGAVFYFYHHESHPRLAEVPLVYLGASVRPTAVCGDRDAFMGAYRDERCPASVERGSLGGEEVHSGEPCAALQHKFEIAPGESLHISYFLGAEPGIIKDYSGTVGRARSTISNLGAEGEIDRQSALVDLWWENHLRVFSCDIPDAAARRQIETWSPVNSVAAARHSRSVNTAAPGIRGIGFRDSCQDMLGIAYRNPAWASEVFFYLLSLQFENGSTLHTAHPEEPDRPPSEVVRSDNHLWLPVLAHAIAAETGDVSFLRKEAPFFRGSAPASAWEHLMAGARFTENHLGAHGIPLTLHGDWNDIIGKFSREGRGESVFAGFQYVWALDFLISLARALNDREAADWLAGCRHRQENALLACAWDGGWWRRGFDDGGNPVGSAGSEFGKLWLNPQSWDVLAKIGSREQRVAGMDAAASQLDTGVGLKLLTPGFKTWPEVSDPFSGYGPGTGENGAIFCHANAWAVIAEAELGRGNRAWDYFCRMLPQNVIEKVGLERYAAEPYAWVSNIVGPENPRFGWGNVSQITGTAAWMDYAATAHLLGIRAELGGLRIDPRIRPEWERVSATRRFRGTEFRITIENPQHVSSGVAEIRLEDGSVLPTENGPMIPHEVFAGREHFVVKAILGG